MLLTVTTREPGTGQHLLEQQPGAGEVPHVVGSDL